MIRVFIVIYENMVLSSAAGVIDMLELVNKDAAESGNSPVFGLQLVSGDHSIEGIMRIAGYKDIKTFRMIFKRITGLSRQQYRRKYSRALISI